MVCLSSHESAAHLLSVGCLTLSPNHIGLLNKEWTQVNDVRGMSYPSLNVVPLQSDAVAHNSTSMVCMKDPPKGFGEVICCVDDSWDMTCDDIPGIFSILDSKVLNINMTRAFSGNLDIDHVDGRHVVNKHRRRLDLRKVEFA